MSENPCVLVVDRSEETHEVLQTALGRHGVRTYHARHTQRGFEMADRLHPDVIVFDLEQADTDPAAAWASFSSRLEQDDTPMVILGSIRREEIGAGSREFLAKPYNFGPLVRTIEEMIADANASRRRDA